MATPTTEHADTNTRAPYADPLLDALDRLRHQREATDRRTRLVLAYARECVYPRPYRLADLAAASGLSISGVRGAYTADHVHEARALLDHTDRPDHLREA